MLISDWSSDGCSSYLRGINPNTYTTSLNENRNVAVFGQVGIDLSDLVTPGLKLNLGGRYTWDKAMACGGTFAGRYVDWDECQARAALGLADGTGEIRNKGDAPSWTIDRKSTRLNSSH